MKFLIIKCVAGMFAVTAAFNAYALESISGKWDCSVTRIPGDKEVVLSYRLEVSPDATRYKREGNILIQTGLERVPELELNIFDEGTLTLVQTRLTFTPLKSDMDVIKGHELVEHKSRELMDKLMQDETGELQLKGENQFIFTLTDDEATQLETCIRHRD